MVINIFLILLSGICATLAMSLFMGFIHGLGWANADMIRAIGSIYTRKYEKAFWPGVAIHFTAGAFFSLFYAIIGSISPVHSGGAIILLMTLFGLFHGIAVALLLIVMVVEYHPLAQFREAGLGVMSAHILGHVVYGFMLGLLFAIMRIDMNLIQIQF